MLSVALLTSGAAIGAGVGAISELPEAALWGAVVGVLCVSGERRGSRRALSDVIGSTVDTPPRSTIIQT